MHTIKAGPRKETPKSPKTVLYRRFQAIGLSFTQLLRQIFMDRRPFSPAEWSGAIAFLLFFLLWPVSSYLAVIPLLLFVISCAVFPFFPKSSFFLPVIYKGASDGKAVSLTFDDGPDPASTPALLRLLETYGITATFFVTGQNARRYPEIIRDILAKGHTIGNHTYTHDAFIMFRTTRTLESEVKATQKVFGELGFSANLFRPPVGITTPRFADVIHRTGLLTVTFSRRAGDMGNRRIRNLSTRILNGIEPNDIILLHDVLPKRPGNLEEWLREVERILLGIREKGFEIVPLGALIGRQVMLMHSEAASRMRPLNKKRNKNRNQELN